MLTMWGCWDPSDLKENRLSAKEVTLIWEGKGEVFYSPESHTSVLGVSVASMGQSALCAMACHSSSCYPGPSSFSRCCDPGRDDDWNHTSCPLQSGMVIWSLTSLLPGEESWESPWGSTPSTSGGAKGTPPSSSQAIGIEPKSKAATTEEKVCFR